MKERTNDGRAEKEAKRERERERERERVKELRARMMRMMGGMAAKACTYLSCARVMTT